MHCDAETAYLHQFYIYLGHQQHSANGLGYDIVMKLCQNITGHNHHIYFDNLFSSVPLVKDLLAQNTYACGTVHKTKRDVPLAIKEPGKMARGVYKSMQFGRTNLVATAWKDNKTVTVLSTNCGPQDTVIADWRVGCHSIHINQPKNVNLYNKYMGGVDQHDQMRLQYGLGHFSKKAWKYLLWFFVNAFLVNAYILYQMKSARVTKKKYSHVDFHRDVAQSLIAGFTSRKRKADPLYVGPVMPANEDVYENVHMGNPQMRCKWHSMQKM